MNEIKVLDKDTIDKISAGEVVERPFNVVKELVENSIDAGADAISVEISDGGISLIRISDNGSGIEKNQVRNAFLRHSTSKISTSSDLSFIKTLGFRGEALSSIAAVSKVEFCTKCADSITGVIYKINGGNEISLADAGLPDGSTVIVRDLFYNTPARLKFLKSEKAEASKISDIMFKEALSHPEISFKLIINKKIRFSSPGNNSLKDTIYSVYGRDIPTNLIGLDNTLGEYSLSGFIGKPELARPSRVLELFFVNGRFVVNSVLCRAVEDAYKGFLMKGSFPVTFLNLDIEPELIDVNIHPSKMEIRFLNAQEIYNFVFKSVRDIVAFRENIPYFSVHSGQKLNQNSYISGLSAANSPEPFEINRKIENEDDRNDWAHPEDLNRSFSQLELQTDNFISNKAAADHKIIGVVFDTYWIVEYSDKIYLIDQHAAHEKVLYERFLKRIKNGVHLSQTLSPPIILSLPFEQEEVLKDNLDKFREVGFEINHFGGSEYALSGVPADMYSLSDSDLFISFLTELSGTGGTFSSDILDDRIATAACKAAVKGGDVLSESEAKKLIDELLTLDNPYNCPHGRPTIIAMTKYELEKKFKRLI